MFTKKLEVFDDCSISIIKHYIKSLSSLEIDCDFNGTIITINNEYLYSEVQEFCKKTRIKTRIKKD